MDQGSNTERRAGRSQAEHTVEILAKAHHILRPLKRNERPPGRHHQTELFD